MNRGVVFTIQYWTNLAGNPIGGIEQGFTYTDQSIISVDFDMTKLVGRKGGGLHVVFNNRIGTGHSNEDIGNDFQVQHSGNAVVVPKHHYFRREFFCRPQKRMVVGSADRKLPRTRKKRG
jgi:Carbohydrate-selective porin, OprB family